jgi:hypothetical protein
MDQKTKDALNEIALMAIAIIDVCHCDLEDKTTAIQLMAQRIGMTADGLNEVPVRSGPEDWLG